MIINHNMNALNAHRNMALNNVNSGKSMEKLSSGLRINRAGDDAAGLAISEKMRGQIRGLDQASRNAQDGISLIQTAEGALNETHSILQRMKELATQSANDTNTVKDREQIQNELNQLTSEVNRIGNTTEFNTIKLVDGSAGSANPSNITTPSGGTTTGGTPTGGASTGGATGGTSPTTPLTQSQKDRVATLQGLQSWWIGGSTEIIKNSFGLDAAGSNIKVNFIDDPSSGALASVGYKIYTNAATGVPVTGKGEDLTLNVNMNYFKNLDLSTNQNGSSPSSSLYLDRTMVHEMTHAVMSQTMNFASLNTWFKEGSAEFAHGADERLKNDLFQLSGQNVVSNQFQLSDAGVAALSSKLTDKTSWAANGATDTSQYYSAAYVAMRYMDEQLDKSGVTGGVKAIMGYLSANQTKTLDDALANVANTPWKNEADFITAFKNDVKTLADLQNKCDITLNSNTVVKDSHLYFANEVDTGSMLGSDSNSGTGTALNAEDVIKETATVTSSTPTGTEKVGGFNVTWTDPLAAPTTGSSGSPVIYVAANANPTAVSAPSTSTVGSTSGTITGTALTSKIKITDKVIEATTTSSNLTNGVEIHDGKSGKATGTKAYTAAGAAGTVGANIANDSNELTLTIDGTQKTIALAVKNYDGTSGNTVNDMLNDINTKLNTALSTTGKTYASVNAEGKIEFASQTKGTASSVTVDGGNALTHLLANNTDKISSQGGVSANNSLEITVGATKTTITLDNKNYKDANELVSALNTKLTGTALDGKVTVKADVNSLVLTGSNKEEISVSGGAAQNILGFSNVATTKAQDVNNELKITVDGEAIALKVASGEFDANEIAGMLQNKINEGTKTTKDITVSVKDGRLVLESGSKGSSSKIEIQDNALAKSLGVSTGSINRNGETGAANSIKLQIGANQGQSISLSISDMRAKALGITGEKGSNASVAGAKFTTTNSVSNGTDSNLREASLDILSHSSATAAIKVIDDAINKVSTERSTLGAYQNRLEHTIANLGTSSENLTAAESRVRDVDMAKEMMNFSKNNILTQAAQAMLAQAKSQPESVLQLLR